jgi:hypothetical protein
MFFSFIIVRIYPIIQGERIKNLYPRTLTLTLTLTLTPSHTLTPDWKISFEVFLLELF